jgi:hypothetical protein
MSLSKSQRQIVRDRAKNCCEYCHLSATSHIVPFHIDHILPKKHGGTDETDNLCFACFTCNAYKSHDLAGVDPITGQITPLYHPRLQMWAEHFELQDNMQINGLTAIGRTTMRVLQLNLDERIELRQTLAKLGEYPCYTN